MRGISFDYHGREGGKTRQAMTCKRLCLEKIAKPRSFRATIGISIAIMYRQAEYDSLQRGFVEVRSVPNHHR